MPLYVEVDHDGVTYRISTEDISDIHFWDGVIVDMGTPQYTTESDLGGLARMTFGDIGISSVWFDDVDIWPPPINMAARIYYSQGTEIEKRLCWSATIHRKSISPVSISYSVYDQAFDTMLLTEAEDYNGDTVPMPMALGTVSLMPAVRLADEPVTGYYRYCLADIQGVAGSDWYVYDDGLDITANVQTASGNVFTLDPAPVGAVYISGTGAVTNLQELCAWACDASRLNLTLNATFASDARIDHEATSQMLLIDFLSKVAAPCQHLFYVIDDMMMLCDMEKDPPGIATVMLDMDGDGINDETGASILGDNDTIILGPGDYLDSTSFTDPPPKSLLKSRWIVRTAVEETVGKYVKEVEGSYTRKTDYPYGDEMDIDAYLLAWGFVFVRVTAAMWRLEMPRVKVSVPMVSLPMLPAPGQKFIILDDRTPRSLTIYAHVRSVSYDFINMTVTIQGEGSLT